MKLKNIGDDYFWKSSSDAALLTVTSDDVDQVHLHQPNSSPSLTLTDLLNALPECERHTLKSYYKWDDASILAAKESNKVGDIDEDIIPILQLSRFTYKDFRNFFAKLEKFYLNTRWELKSRELRLKIVTSAKGYMIPLVFEFVLKTLIANYGDASPSCEGSIWFKTIEWKSIMCFLLCEVVKGMCNTQVVDITRNLLQQWYFHLRFISFWGGI